MKIVTPLMKLVEMPELMLLPARLVRIFLPVCWTSQAMLVTVVFPSVPVIAKILSGLPTYLRKSGHSLRASAPGKSVPLCFVILSSGMDSFAAHRAR